MVVQVRLSDGLYPGGGFSDWKIAKGFDDRVSQTVTLPSWHATANFRPSGAQAVLKLASVPAGKVGRERSDARYAEMTGTTLPLYVLILSNCTLSGPDMLYKKTSLVSPTASNVRPSGDIDATTRVRNTHQDPIGTTAHCDLQGSGPAMFLLETASRPPCLIPVARY